MRIKKRWLILGIIGILMYSSWQQKNSPIVNQPKPAGPHEYDAPFVLVHEELQKKKAFDQPNRLEVYTYAGNLHVDMMKVFLQYRQEQSRNSGVIFLQVVVLKSADAYRESRYPVPAAFSGTDEESIQKSIRVNYVCNYLNGYSEATWHEDNTYEHPVKTEQI